MKKCYAWKQNMNIKIQFKLYIKFKIEFEFNVVIIYSKTLINLPDIPLYNIIQIGWGWREIEEPYLLADFGFDGFLVLRRTVVN